jgi:hypothetical protein
MLEKHHITLNKEQVTTRKTLGYSFSHKSKRPMVSKMRRQAEEALEEKIKRDMQ